MADTVVSGTETERAAEAERAAESSAAVGAAAPHAAAFIELDGVEKVFDVRKKTGFLKREQRQVRAVDGLSFTVSRGDHGCIGPNGAGKSTTIKMLTGILTPSGGRLRWPTSTRPGSGPGWRTAWG
ncbi:hypothetical protein SALBM311S_03900 [Streptomyces alboniger]